MTDFIPARPVVAPIPPNTGYYSSLDSFVPAIRVSSSSRATRPTCSTTSRPRMSGSPSTTFLCVNGIAPPKAGHLVCRQFNLRPDSRSRIGRTCSLHAQVPRELVDVPCRKPARLPGRKQSVLLGDLLDAVATKYSAMYNLPVLSPSQAEIGEIMKARMAYNAAIAGGVKGKDRVRAHGHHRGDQPDRCCGDCAADRCCVGRRVLRRAADCAARGCCRRHHDRCGPCGLDSCASRHGRHHRPQHEYAAARRHADLQRGDQKSGPNSVTGASFSNNLQAGLGTITNVVTQVSAGATTPTFATTPTSLSGLVSMPAGGQITVTYQASVSATATGTLTSTASVTEPADRNDPNSVNNTATRR